METRQINSLFSQLSIQYQKINLLQSELKSILPIHITVTQARIMYHLEDNKQTMAQLKSSFQEYPDLESQILHLISEGILISRDSHTGNHLILLDYGKAALAEIGSKAGNYKV